MTSDDCDLAVSPIKKCQRYPKMITGVKGMTLDCLKKYCMYRLKSMYILHKIEQKVTTEVVINERHKDLL